MTRDHESDWYQLMAQPVIGWFAGRYFPVTPVCSIMEPRDSVAERHGELGRADVLPVGTTRPVFALVSVRLALH